MIFKLNLTIFSRSPIRGRLFSTTSKLPLLALSAAAVTGVWVKVLSAFMRERNSGLVSVRDGLASLLSPGHTPHASELGRGGKAQGTVSAWQPSW